MSTHLSAASIGLGLNAALNVLNGGFIDIYTGPQPASPDVAVTTQTKLARCALANTAFAAAVGTSKTANAIAQGTGLAAGAAAWFRAVKSDGTTAVIDGSAGTSGTDMTMLDNNVISGEIVAVTSWVITWPQ